VTAPRQDGYSILILLAGVAITLIAMGAAVPTWRYVMQDDREQELLFRGGEIADAIARYQKKNGGTLPVSLEVLVKGRFLRRAYKDPMTKAGEWRFLRQGEAIAPPGVTTGPGGPLGGSPGPGTSPSPSPSPFGASSSGGAPGGPALGLGGFVGVASRSKARSLRVMNNAKTYDAWLFIAGRPRIVGKQPITPGVPSAPGGTRAPVGTTRPQMPRSPLQGR
jgi:type II secretory pathway pseudopilin PulG